MTMRRRRPHIPPSRVRFLLSYDPATGVFLWRHGRRHGPCARPGSVAGSLKPCGHRQIKVEGVSYYTGPLAVAYMTGRWPKEDVDHKNGVASDDRWDNLRECGFANNAKNRAVAANNTSGVTGVQWHKRIARWAAVIRCNKTRIHLGYFDKYEDAVAERAAAENKYYGEFTRISR